MTTVRADSPDLSDLSARYLLDLEAKRCPYANLERIRTEQPVHKSGAGTWIVTGYSAAVAVLRDPRFSRAIAAEGAVKGMFPPDDPSAEIYLAKMANCDGETHSRLRRIVAATFTVRSIARWQPFVDQAAAEIIGEIAPLGEADLVSSFCYPFTERVICTMLGIPFEDRVLFEEWAVALNSRPSDPMESPNLAGPIPRAMTEFTSYLRSYLDERRSKPGDDLLSELLAAEEAGDRLNETELLGTLVQLINGGHDTTANFIVTALWTLLEHPAVLERARRDESAIPGIVEECLRIASPVQTTPIRVASEDVEVEGTRIPRGDTVILVLAAADRDPGAFPEAGSFDASRRPNHHIAFGFGAHVCLGAPLARAESTAAVRAICRRLPGLRLAVDPSELTWRNSHVVVAPDAFPLTWKTEDH